ncbi:hypothetical protein GCM10022204_25920 [Microlunatus aurantiacus]|uniref:Asparagine synthase (Glutamine-hydrolysing) n=1 Tax=Microlunatus aurantiacus TaxID=446786 RepID=A0ABP7DMM1_9ACTN
MEARMSLGALPGVLAVTRRDGQPALDELSGALAAIGVPDAFVSDAHGIGLGVWGLPQKTLTPDQPLILSRTNWHRDGSVAPSEIARWIAESSLRPLDEMLPPFAALGLARDGVRVAADRMGFRQIYRISNSALTAVSTSARALSAIDGSGLDEDALAVQSQLGWQLGQSTLFGGVEKLPPGESVTVTSAGATSNFAPVTEIEPLTLDEAVRRASTLMRHFLGRYLDENPDPVLQLTGGQDSRLLLSAIPVSRRRGLRVMTVDAPGTADAAVAAELSARFGLRHSVLSLDGLTGLTPVQCYELVWEAAVRLDCMADPLARAATLWAERSIEQGPRLSGLGGEIARGFYYAGRVRPTPLTEQRTERLARWRMFANEPVEPEALAERLSRDAFQTALDAVHEALRGGGTSWYEATDELYYRHRMQRWAGLGESAVCFDRILTNPMLDYRFLEIARGLTPKDKQHSRFLARLQLALDDELASIRLDDRPPPRAYAQPALKNWASIQVSTMNAAARKAQQRLLRTRRPPAGGAVIARLLWDHLRECPELLEPAFKSGVFATNWLEGLLRGSQTPAPSSLALLMNVLVACGPLGEQRGPADNERREP